MKIEVGAIDSFKRDQGVRVSVGDDRIAMFRVGDDFYAIGDKCSHAEASLVEGDVYGTDVECPRHGSEFDMKTGKPLQLPATAAVPTYEVSVEDGTVYLIMEDS